MTMTTMTLLTMTVTRMTMTTTMLIVPMVAVVVVAVAVVVVVVIGSKRRRAQQRAPQSPRHNSKVETHLGEPMDKNAGSISS